MMSSVRLRRRPRAGRSVCWPDGVVVVCEGVCVHVCVWPQEDVRTPPDAACGTCRKLRHHHHHYH